MDSYVSIYERLKALFGNYAPRSCYVFLEDLKMYIDEGNYVEADALIWRMNNTIRKFRSKKMAVMECYNILFDKYLKSDCESKIKMDLLDEVTGILYNILLGFEDRDILKYLVNIEFNEGTNLDSLVTYKTKSLCFECNSDKTIRDADLIIKLATIDNYVLCFGLHNGTLEKFRVSKSYFNKKYSSVFELYKRNNCLNKVFLDSVVKRIGMDEENFVDTDLVVSINKIVKYLENLENLKEISRQER